MNRPALAFVNKDASRYWWSTRHAAMIVLAAGLGGTPCLPADAEPLKVPVLSNPATGVHLVGKLIWLALATTDLQGAKRVYRALFG